jgi:hypothetical protein
MPFDSETGDFIPDTPQPGGGGEPTGGGGGDIIIPDYGQQTASPLSEGLIGGNMMMTVMQDPNATGGGGPLAPGAPGWGAPGVKGVESKLAAAAGIGFVLGAIVVAVRHPTIIIILHAPILLSATLGAGGRGGGRRAGGGGGRVAESSI